MDGDLYPTSPVPGQNQYKWEAATFTWRLLGTATGVVPGTYGNPDNIPQITVDATGRITVATDIPIGTYYVKTNNPSAFNGYVWPNVDGGAGDFLTTDGAGNLTWVPIPVNNYWQLVGSSLEPISNSYDLLLRDPSNDITFYVDNTTGILELSAPGGAGSTFLQFFPDNTLSTITAASSPLAAEALAVRGSVLSWAAYGNSFLNTPSEVTLTQSLFDSSVSISTDGFVTVNAGSAQSFRTPATRGTSGQFLMSNGDGTTTWSSTGYVNYWQRNLTNLSPATPGDTVQVLNTSSVPTVELDPAGIVRAIAGLTSVELQANYAANTTRLVSFTNSTQPGFLEIDGRSVVLRAYGNSFANPDTTLTIDAPGQLVFESNIGGSDTTLFSINNIGTLQTGLYIDGGAPAFTVIGSSGNTTVAGTLTVNAGTPVPGSLNAYTFPGNRGVKDFALFTNADGSTRWDNVANVAGYWDEAPSTLEIYPTAAGQNVVIRDSGSVTSIELNADGYITSSGGDINNPTYGFFGSSTGFYGGTTSEINIGVNGVLCGTWDINFFSIYQDINFFGSATNAGADAIFENTNTEVKFTASSSSSPALAKNFIFENYLNNEVLRINTTGDLIVNQGNAAIGSTNVNTTANSITLSIGNNAANEAGRLKLYSTFNGGDGFELFQVAATGNVTMAVNSSATPTIEFDATTATINGDATVTGNLEVQANFSVPSPTIPPASTSPGNQGEIAWDANFIYVCIAPNTWRRSPLATW
jgi:hypothetical protein